MTEVDDFARLRPLVDRFDEATKASLRAALFESAPVASTEGVGPAPTKAAGLSADPAPAKLMESPGRTYRRPSRGHRALAAVAATLAVVGGWALVREVTETESMALQTGADSPASSTASPVKVSPSPSTPADAASAVSNGSVSLSPGPIPLLGIVDLPGWTLGYASIRDDPGNVLVLASPDQGINGPIAKIEGSTDSTSVYGDTSTDVVVNGERGLLSGIGDISYLSWTTPGSDPLKITAYGLDESKLLDLAEAVEIDEAGQFTLGHPVVDLVPVDQASAAAMRTGASYTFTNADGRELQVSIYAGGNFLHALRVGGENREKVSFDGQEVPLLDYGQGSGRYRVNFVEGFWAWEFDGEPFADNQAFLDVIGHLVPVDQATWDQSLPAGLIGPPQRSAAIAEMLSDLPVPAQFDIDGLANRPVTDRREAVAAEVAGAVSCAWFDTWIAAYRNSDQAAARTAAEAIQAVGQSTLIQQAGLYADGVSEYAPTLSADLLDLIDSSASQYPDQSIRELRQAWPCFASG